MTTDHHVIDLRPCHADVGCGERDPGSCATIQALTAPGLRACERCIYAILVCGALHRGARRWLPSTDQLAEDLDDTWSAYSIGSAIRSLVANGLIAIDPDNRYRVLDPGGRLFGAGERP